MNFDTEPGPPPGKDWVTIEIESGASVRGSVQSGFYLITSHRRGPAAETAAQKKARLFREAADLIRRGTELTEPVGSPKLQAGLRKISEALEVVDE